jgi:mannose-6-phosphate isomerase-like protein (cupin superfamily)
MRHSADRHGDPPVTRQAEENPEVVVEVQRWPHLHEQLRLLAGVLEPVRRQRRDHEAIAGPDGSGLAGDVENEMPGDTDERLFLRRMDVLADEPAGTDEEIRFEELAAGIDAGAPKDPALTRGRVPDVARRVDHRASIATEMAHSGEQIRNPATGETVTFLVTTAESKGRLLQLEMSAAKSAAPRHQHPRLSEHWDLRAGSVHFEVAGAEQLLEAPAQLTIPPGTPHRFWSDSRLQTVVDYEPAGGFEAFLETIYALAVAGKTNSKGMPNPLRAAVIAAEHLDDYALPWPSVAVQRVLFRLLAPVGRLLGYRAHYP